MSKTIITHFEWATRQWWNTHLQAGLENNSEMWKILKSPPQFIHHTDYLIHVLCSSIPLIYVWRWTIRFYINIIIQVTIDSTCKTIQSDESKPNTNLYQARLLRGHTKTLFSVFKFKYKNETYLIGIVVTTSLTNYRMMIVACVRVDDFGCQTKLNLPNMKTEMALQFITSSKSMQILWMVRCIN